mmetsp:Transcript_57276/g.79464  ORF Transcript_57276/g.79464 Transcript_57276/m.79464 type:complete len:174 (-) Transcript_57276:187-708(-)
MMGPIVEDGIVLAHDSSVDPPMPPPPLDSGEADCRHDDVVTPDAVRRRLRSLHRQTVASYVEPLQQTPLTRSRSNSNAREGKHHDLNRSLSPTRRPMSDGVLLSSPDVADLAPILDVKVRTGLISEDEYRSILGVVRRASLAASSEGDLQDSEDTRERADSRGFEDIMLTTDP